MEQSSKVFANLIWRFMERCGAQVVTFVVSIILARILDPSIYGTIALVTVFTSILQVFIDSGLGNALIQKKNADDVDFSTVFYFNSILCCVLYCIVFLVAPYISKFYDMPELTLIVRVMSISILISGVKNIQQAYVSKNLLFKKFFFATLFGTVFSAILGIFLALYGFGVWALIAQNLTNQLIDTIILWFTVRWRPHKMFSFNRLKALIAFGSKLFISAMFNTIYGNIQQLIIGKKYTSADLAYYNKGRQFPNLIVYNINSSLDSVLFPALSSKQDEIHFIKNMVKKSITLGNYLLAPLLLGLGAVAEPLIKVLLTEKWLFCVPYLRLFCLIFVFQPMHTSNKNAIKAMGRGDIIVRQEIINDIIGISVLLITMRSGVWAIACGYFVSTNINLFVNCYPNKSLLNYSFWEQLTDILPSTLLSLVMAFVVYISSMLFESDFWSLLVAVPTGAAVYLLGSAIFKLNSFMYLKQILKTKIKSDYN